MSFNGGMFFGGMGNTANPMLGNAFANYDSNSQYYQPGKQAAQQLQQNFGAGSTAFSRAGMTIPSTGYSSATGGWGGGGITGGVGGNSGAIQGLINQTNQQNQQNFNNAQNANIANWQTGVGMLNSALSGYNNSGLTQGANGIAQNLLNNPNVLDKGAIQQIMNRQTGSNDAMATQQLRNIQGALGAGGQGDASSMAAAAQSVGRNQMAANAGTQANLATQALLTNRQSNIDALNAGAGQAMRNFGVNFGGANSYLQNMYLQKPYLQDPSGQIAAMGMQGGGFGGGPMQGGAQGGFNGPGTPGFQFHGRNGDNMGGAGSMTFAGGAGGFNGGDMFGGAMGNGLGGGWGSAAGANQGRGSQTGYNPNGVPWQSGGGSGAFAPQNNGFMPNSMPNNVWGGDQQDNQQVGAPNFYGDSSSIMA